MKSILIISIFLLLGSHGFGQEVDTVKAENLKLNVLNNDWENARMHIIGDSMPFNGVMVSYYPETNKLETIVQYKNGQTKNCWSKSYYSNGQIKEELRYGNQIGAEHGRIISWFENGNPKITGKYKNGGKTGKWKYYHKNGKLESLVTFKNGKRNGKYFRYYTDGRKIASAKYKNGVLVESTEFLLGPIQKEEK